MSYEVRKTIRGRDYRYMVESHRDPETGKVRNTWRYLGKAGGEVLPRRRLRAAATRANLAAALGRLLGRTPWGKITVHAIAAEAGVAPATFYRHFSSRDEVLQAYDKDAKDQLQRSLTQLHAIAGDADQERARLRSWLFALWISGPAVMGARDRGAQHGRMFERYLELLWVHGYTTIVARDRPGLATALSLILDAQLRKEQHAELASTIERLIFG
jgi:AcrR family transcriptional regulator